MLYAKIVKYNKDGVKVLAKLSFDGKKIVAMKGSNPMMIHTLRDRGVVGLFGKHYTVNDGEKFMRSLPVQYQGSLVRAYLVKGDTDAQ